MVEAYWYRVKVFGGVRIDRAGAPALGKPARDMLACFAAHAAVSPGKILTREFVTDIVWPYEDYDEGRYPTDIKGSFNNAYSAIRRALQGKDTTTEPLLTESGLAHLNTALVEVDLVTFRQAYKASNTILDPGKRLEKLEEAARLSPDRLPDRYLRHRYLRNMFEQLQGWQFEVHYRLAEHYAKAGNKEQALHHVHLAHLADNASPEPEALSQAFALTNYTVSGRGSFPTFDTTDVDTGLSAAAPEHQLSETSKIASIPVFLTPYFGREDEIKQLSELLSAFALAADRPNPSGDTRRIVTITGMGGTGKTRFALEVANAASIPFQGAVGFVPLAEVTSEEAILPEIATCLGLPHNPDTGVRDQVAQALSKGPFLLVLDNFEQLLDQSNCSKRGWRTVKQLVEDCPRLVVLVTSRETLNIDGERLWPLEPLYVPGEADTSEELIKNPCVQMFADRAQARYPQFVLDENNMRTVARLCRALDGLPLAIELAAARIRLLDPEAMLVQIVQSRLDWLKSNEPDRASRQASLIATFDWSYRLLDPVAQAFLISLSVFLGGWDLFAAAEVCSGGNLESAGDCLEALIDSSLVTLTSYGTELRFTMLQTVRQYCAALRGAQTDNADRHRDYYFGLVAQAHPMLEGPNAAKWTATLQTEHSNIRAAIENYDYNAANPDAVLKAAGEMTRYWRRRGNLDEGHGILRRILAQSSAGANTIWRATALNGAGSIAYMLSDYVSATAYYQEGRTIARTLGNTQVLAVALRGLGHIALAQARYGEARQAFNESLAIARELGHSNGIALSLLHLSVIPYVRGECAEARTLIAECCRLWQDSGSTNYSSAIYQHALICFAEGDLAGATAFAADADARDRALGSGGMAAALLGRIAVERYDYSGGQRILNAQLDRQQRIGNRTCVATVLEYLGILAWRQGDHYRARSLFMESLAISKEVGNKYNALCTLGEIAMLETAEGRHLSASRLFAAIDDAHANLGTSVPPYRRGEYTDAVNRVSLSLPAEAASAGCSPSDAVPLEDAIAYALALGLEGFGTEFDTQVQEKSGVLPALTSSQEALPPVTVPNNLPVPQTAFVGRVPEIQNIMGLLAAKRLVTVTGPGGCGKTRLILEVAAKMMEGFADGVWAVELASVSDPVMALHEIATAANLDIKASDTVEALAQALRPKKMLLVLDNCEHLRDACARIAGTIHKTCRGIVILASSRIPLGLYGEQACEVLSMSMPDPTRDITGSELYGYDAARLFLERAKSFKTSFDLTDKNAPAVAWICYRLEGMPLAIELAAAWMRSLSVYKISDNLKGSFALLNVPNKSYEERHRTLNAVIGSSYKFLGHERNGPALQALFRRLSVFVGDWTYEAAQAVCARDGIEDSEMMVLQLITSLVERSLIVQRNDGSTSRYYMLEMVREYGLDQLHQNGEQELTRTRHLQYYVGLAWHTNIHRRGAKQMQQFDIFDEEYPNILAGIEWCFGSIFRASDQPDKYIAANLERAAELLSTLSRFLGAREHYSLVRKLFDFVLEARRSHPVSLTWANLYHEAGGLARMQGDYNQARKLYTEGLRIRDAFRDRQGIARSLYCIGLAFSDEGRYAEAQTLFRCALDINRHIGTESRFYVALCLNGLGNVAWRLGNISEAEPQLAEAMAIMRALHDGQGMALVHYNMAYLALSRGELAAASDDFLASLAIEHRIGDRPRIAEILEGLATLARVRNTPESAVYLYALAVILREVSGMPVPHKDEPRIKHDTDALRTELGGEVVDHQYSQVTKTTLDGELDRCCDGLRAEHPNIWDDALSPLDLSSEKAFRRPAAAHLLVSLGQFLKSRELLHDTNAGADQADYPVGTLNSGVFITIANSALEDRAYDLAAAYYSIGLDLAQRADDQPHMAACLEGMRKSNIADHDG
jgi:predicted ATPase/DNA-binding SARP family transcriptional activator